MGIIWGAVYAVLAAGSFALWNIFLQRGLEKGAGPRMALFTLSVSTAGAFAPVVLWLGLQGSLPPLPRAGVLWFLAAGLMTAAVGPFFATHATRRIGASRTVSLRLLDPFFTLVIATLFLQEGLHVQVILGIALIVGALGLLQSDTRKRAEAAAVGGPGAPAGSGMAFGVAASLSFTLGSVARKSGLVLIPSAFVAGIGEGIAGVMVVLPALLAPGGREVVRSAFRRQHLDLWWSGLASAAGTLFLNLALQRIPIAVAVTLRNTSPWFSLLLVPLLLGNQHRPSRLVWGSTALLTAGMLLIVLR